MAEDRQAVVARAKSIVRRGDKATLATLMGATGDPYTSLVMVACDQTGAPLMLLSELAQHTKNISDDPRAALAFDATHGHQNPLTGPRLSLLGHVEQSNDQTLLDRYVRRYEDALGYLALGDFRLFRLAVERAHIVAGFGAIHWFKPAEIMTPPAPALVAAEADIIAHMNEDHADALALYAGAGADAAGTWIMTGIDPHGLDLACPTGRLRCDFDTPIHGPTAVRRTLAAMARAARTDGAG